MSFPRYPKYKASGVEWLGEVPEHWDLTAIRRVISPQLTNGLFKKKDEFGEGILLVNVFDVYQEDFRIHFNSLDRVKCDAIEEFTYQVLPGDLFFVRSSLKQEGIAAVCVAEECGEPVVFECHLIRARPIKEVFDGRFGSYLLNSVVYRSTMIAKAKVTTMTTIDQEAILSTILPMPAVAEQTKIAAFLDRETAKIDGLVSEQRRLIELLKEKRRAVISHAVTEGLNPDALMKPSGIEWLGDVPEHWEVERLKYSITKIEQGWSPQCDNEPAVDGEWGVMKVGCGNRDEFDPTEHKALPLDLVPLTEYEIHSGDILMSRGNTRELVGMATLVKQVRPKLLLCDLLYRFHSRHERTEPEFLVFSLRSANVRFQIEREATGTSASMKKIGQGTIREFVICLPPLDEQRAIIAFINAETANLDALTAEAERGIGLLQERRTALISAAVTGKIDVRGLVATEAA